MGNSFLSFSYFIYISYIEDNVDNRLGVGILLFKVRIPTQFFIFIFLFFKFLFYFCFSVVFELICMSMI